MLLRQILQVLEDAEIQGLDPSADMEITGIADDSREAGPGMLFVAIQGEHVDGHHYIRQAVEKGAVAVMTEKQGDVKEAVGIRVKSSMDSLAKVSARFFQNPFEEMTLVGITGTNGKTTSSLLIQSILAASGKGTGLIGTLRYEIGDENVAALNTTPNALHLQRLLRRMRQIGLQACVMEVSSHAMVFSRVKECRFDTRVFTNLSRDHLDFHANMEAYYQAKRLLFGEVYGKESGSSVVNIDDSWGKKLAQECHGKVWTYGIENQADFQAMGPEFTIHGLFFRVQTPEGEVDVSSPLIGIYNVYNILSAYAVGFSLGIPKEVILKGIAQVGEVAGRFEKFSGPGFTVVVDYAHTDDALRRLLQNARQLCEGRLITVFGCGGDRDPGKRPLMGNAAAKLSDVVIVTSDNPRTEESSKIIDQILVGIPDSSSAQVDVIPDRRDAIETGIREARTGDMVVIAGKGHEDYQILGETRIHFDDREEVRRVLKQIGKNKTQGLQPES